nr:chloride intracellular channel protein 6-like isoform X2 [Dermatophagoides farinae]
MKFLSISSILLFVVLTATIITVVHGNFDGYKWSNNFNGRFRRQGVKGPKYNRGGEASQSGLAGGARQYVRPMPSSTNVAAASSSASASSNAGGQSQNYGSNDGSQFQGQSVRPIGGGGRYSGQQNPSKFTGGQSGQYWQGNAGGNDNSVDSEPPSYGGVQGTPGVDFPNYARIPNTAFTCNGVPYEPGMYADEETRCQVYHVCFQGRKESFLCGVGTVFNQAILACDYWHAVDCGASRKFYSVNEELGKAGAEPSQGGQAASLRGPTGPSFSSPGPTGPSIQAQGPTGPSFSASGPTGPSFQAQGPTGPSFSASGPTGPSFQAEGPTGPSFSSSGPTGPSFSSSGPTGPSFSASGPTRPSYQAEGPTGSSYQAEGPTGPSFQAEGPTGPSFSSSGPTGPSFQAQGPTGPSFQAEGPTGPSFSASGPTGPSFSASGPTGPSFSASGPTGPSFQAEGPTGPSFSASGPTGPSFSASGPTGPSFQAEGPTGPSFSASGPTGPSFSASGPTGPSFQAQGPTGPSFQAEGPTGPTGPSGFGPGTSQMKSDNGIEVESGNLQVQPQPPMRGKESWSSMSAMRGGARGRGRGQAGRHLIPPAIGGIDFVMMSQPVKTPLRPSPISVGKMQAPRYSPSTSGLHAPSSRPQGPRYSPSTSGLHAPSSRPQGPSGYTASQGGSFRMIQQQKQQQFDNTQQKIEY